jgi:hypothetical protein
MEEKVALAWDPPNCLRIDSSRSLLENDKYPPFPEAEEQNLRNEES